MNRFVWLAFAMGLAASHSTACTRTQSNPLELKTEVKLAEKFEFDSATAKKMADAYEAKMLGDKRVKEAYEVVSEVLIAAGLYTAQDLMNELEGTMYLPFNFGEYVGSKAFLVEKKHALRLLRDVELEKVENGSVVIFNRGRCGSSLEAGHIFIVTAERRQHQLTCTEPTRWPDAIAVLIPIRK